MTTVSMQAMVLEKPGALLQLKTLPVPAPAAGQVLIKVAACGVCRTDLHILDGDLPTIVSPIIPGHEIVGEVVALGDGVTLLRQGDKVGVPWLAYACGHCKYCAQGQENLCENALFTGYSVNGGYAEYTVAWEAFCVRMPVIYSNASGAPMLCAGLIGFRSWRMVNEHAQHIGIYGFGAAAHILTQVANFQYKSIYAFTKPDDGAGQQFALEMGAIWAGSSLEAPPVKLDAAIIFAPDGSLVPLALSHLDKGGIVVCGGIHMSRIPGFPYSMLWEERTVKSVANLTRDDAALFFKIAPQVPVTTSTQLFPLHQANEALENLRAGKIRGAAVLVMP
ncbi:zinc-dependent alcohol dehydrogenase family protein [Chitinophaga sp.]|uniref:zinc-dependent alcohol dehydrogenase family protein n=1 Tax=Chitinophaga sp. TaxID=1869181 RepID=UPI002B82A2A9|nr:zinc-dependent alcohol dehydrogenase family protein [Chitinophaga sp.]HWV64589.1 zinc-dependent alcohol dehydrogenase family protein [Chitinophaga sp.]